MAPVPDQVSLRTISRSNSSSSRGHIVESSHEASGLLLPDQNPRNFPVQKLDVTAIVDHVDNQDGTHLPSFPSPAPLRPSSTQEAKVAQPTSFRRAMHWKTVGMIVGFLFAGLLSALGHYLLARDLDGTLTDTAYLKQSQVSAVSILLATIFKAALTASTGICFAQHLWFVLRGNAMSLSAIEKLFAFRANIFALCDMRSIWRAPLLFFMALLVWSLGLATIYPPGSLIVTFEAHNYTKNRNVSVMNPPVPHDLETGTEYTFPSLGKHQFLFGKWTFEYRYIVPFTPHAQLDIKGSRGTSQVLINIAKSIMTNDQVFDLLVHPGENSTYNMQFRAPQFRCSVSRRNTTMPLESTIDEGLVHLAFSSKLGSPSQNETVMYSMSKYYIERVIRRSLDNATTYEALLTTVDQSCTPYSMLNDVNISFPRGIRTIEHRVSDPRAIPGAVDIYNQHAPSVLNLSNPADTHAVEEWRQRIFTALPVSNEWALLDALGAALKAEWYWEFFGGVSGCVQNDAFENSTKIEVCSGLFDAGGPLPNSTGSSLMGTVFDLKRFDQINDKAGSSDLRNLNITEDLLNSVLTNLTLSAISLGTWWELTPVTFTRYQSKYSFANPLNLILPYSLCLVAATLFAVIATWSLWQNGIPAADGGFLQIMMATRGNTVMERLVLKERLMAADSISKELKSLKIRYGELVLEDALRVEGRRLGFGTVQETVSLRKRRET